MEQQNRKTQEHDRTINIKATVLIILSGIIILLLLLHLVDTMLDFKEHGSRNNDLIAATLATEPDSNDTVSEGNIPNLSDEDLKAAIKQKQDESAFTVQVVSSGEIKAGSKDLYLSVANPETNKQDCRVRFFLDGEKIYTSPVMPPKSYITHETLSKTLERGNYDINVQYSIIDDAGKEASVAEVASQIICK